MNKNSYFRFLLGLLLLYFSLLSTRCATNHLSSFELEVFIKGLKKGTVVLQTLRGGRLFTVDTFFVKREQPFYFEGKLFQPKLFWITVIKKENARMPIFLEPGQISLKAHIDSLVYPHISGSQSHGFYQTYKKTMRYFSLKEADLIKKKLLAYKNKNLDQIKDISQSELGIRRNKLGYLANFVIAHPRSAVSGYVALENLPQLSSFMIDTISSVLSQAEASSTYIKSFLDIANSLKKTKVGKPFPFGIKQPLLERDTLNISEVEGPKLLLFWSAESENALRMRDKLAAFIPKLKKMSLQVISIALETDKNIWKQAVKNHPIEGGYEVSDLKGVNNEVVRAMSVIQIPHIILVNRNGVIAWRDADFQDAESLTQLIEMPL